MDLVAVEESGDGGGAVNEAAARLAALRAGLDAIAAALEQDYLAVLPGMIDRHDAGVREFCALPGANAHATEVRALREQIARLLPKEQAETNDQ